jgi:guanylate kinase
MQHGIDRRGLMLVLSSPSGAGKTTISRELLKREPNLVMSISATTRRPRPGEADGQDYCFKSDAEFAAMVKKGEFLEHARVFDNFYGTPRAPVDAALRAGKDVLFDVDWQGTQKLKESARADLASVFILPPSLAELEQRLHARAQDPPEVVRGRMSRAAAEMSHWAEYDYIVVNVDVESSIARVQAILIAERLRRDRQAGLAEFVEEMCGEG